MDSSIYLLSFIAIILFAVVVARKTYVESAEGKGRIGESNIEAIILSVIVNSGLYGEVLRNIFLPKEDGGTSEVDVLLVCTKGIFVFESKNYAGWIFGDDKHRYWTVSLYAGKHWRGFRHTEKHKLYNPIWQNNSHVKSLQRVIGNDIPITSVIVFSNRCVLKKVENNSNSILLYMDELKHYLSNVVKSNANVLGMDEVNRIYTQLSNYKDKDGEKKRSHIAYVTGQMDNPLICPRCGGKLVLRTARKGDNAGRQFYGCTNYPKCRFIRNLDR